MRLRLVAAHGAAPAIHRGYELTLAGRQVGRIEIFRSGDRSGVRLERLNDASDRAPVDIATEGTQAMWQVEGRPERACIVDGGSVAKRGRAVALVVEALGLMHGLEFPRLTSEGGMQFEFTLPAADGDGADVAPDEVGLWAGLGWRAPAVPVWLDKDALVLRPDAPPPGAGLVAGQVKGYEAALHTADGCLAWVRGTKPGTGDSWALREVATRRSAEAWRERITSLCRPGGDVTTAYTSDQEALAPLMMGVASLYRLERFRAGTENGRRSAVEMLLATVWADGATTAQWTKAVRRAKDALASARESTQPRAAQEVREQAALDELVREADQRLLRDLSHWGWPPGTFAEFQAFSWDWIARRLRALWMDADPAGGVDAKASDD
ncbi:MAG TPA: hypothetical protein VND21_02275 [Planctomycetota bacterium]|nr:hypothetical protein [Planctomycetota bacterium]